MVEKTVNSIISPTMVKQLMEDEDLKKEIEKIAKNAITPEEVQREIYRTPGINEKNVNSKNILVENNQFDEDSVKTQESISNVNQSEVQKSNTGNIKIAYSDQVEVMKIILSVMSISEIKELTNMYKSGKKAEAIGKFKQILSARLSSQQKNRLKEIYYKYYKK